MEAKTMRSEASRNSVLPMSRKPRVLFLAFYFPPLRCVASLRGANMANYLVRAGWEVSVVTPDPSLWQSPDDLDRVAAELDQSRVHRIYTGHRWRSLSSGFLKRSYGHGVKWFLEGILRRFGQMIGIDEMVGWYPEVERACAKLRPGDVDVIMASGSPFGAFRVARRLSLRLRCPYVLDYRDLWTGNPHARSEDRNRDERVEREVLRDCAAVSVVSPSMAGYLSDHFGVENKVHVIPNGYAPADFEGIEPTVFGHFAIVYTGVFLPPLSTADPLMRALRRLTELVPNKPLRFHYYGRSAAHVRESAKACGVEHLVEIHGVVPRRQCLAAVRGAGTAVVVISVNDDGDLADRGIITGKIFEPIGLKTPVLVIAPPGSDVERVVQTVGKGAVFSGSNVHGMAAFIVDLMHGKAPESHQPEAYAWPNLVLKLDAMLRQSRTEGGFLAEI